MADAERTETVADWTETVADWTETVAERTETVADWNFFYKKKKRRGIWREKKEGIACENTDLIYERKDSTGGGRREEGGGRENAA